MEVTVVATICYCEFLEAEIKIVCRGQHGFGRVLV